MMKSCEVRPCEKVFEMEDADYNYYKDEDVIVFECYGKVNLTDKQIEKVLVDDYKWRVKNTLEKISDDDIYNDLLNQIERYEKGIKW